MTTNDLLLDFTPADPETLERLTFPSLHGGPSHIRWSAIEPGDTLVQVSTSRAAAMPTPIVVERLTKTQIVLANGERLSRARGHIIGDSYGHTYRYYVVAGSEQHRERLEEYVFAQHRARRAEAARRVQDALRFGTLQRDADTTMILQDLGLLASYVQGEKTKREQAS